MPVIAPALNLLGDGDGEGVTWSAVAPWATACGVAEKNKESPVPVVSGLALTINDWR